jgi:hypothetical protein
VLESEEVPVLEGDVISQPKNVPASCRPMITLKAFAKASQVSLSFSVMTKWFRKHPISLKSVPGNCVIS